MQSASLWPAPFLMRLIPPMHDALMLLMPFHHPPPQDPPMHAAWSVLPPFTLSFSSLLGDSWSSAILQYAVWCPPPPIPPTLPSATTMVWCGLCSLCSLCLWCPTFQIPPRVTMQLYFSRSSPPCPPLTYIASLLSLSLSFFFLFPHFSTKMMCACERVSCIYVVSLSTSVQLVVWSMVSALCARAPLTRVATDVDWRLCSTTVRHSLFPIALFAMRENC